MSDFALKLFATIIKQSAIFSKLDAKADGAHIGDSALPTPSADDTTLPLVLIQDSCPAWDVSDGAVEIVSSPVIDAQLREIEGVTGVKQQTEGNDYWMEEAVPREHSHPT